LLEASADWSPDAVQLSAMKTAAGLQLNGTKLFVPDASTAHYIVTAARDGGDLVIVVVPTGAAGLSITLLPSMDATRHLYEVDYRDVEVPSANILARGQAARAAIECAIDVATIALGAEMVGGMQWMLDTAVEYAKTRKQFGKAIGQFQAIQHHCADMLLLN